MDDKIKHISNIARRINYKFLIRTDEDYKWFVHFYKHDNCVFKEFFKVYTFDLDKTLDELLIKINSELL